MRNVLLSIAASASLMLVASGAAADGMQRGSIKDVGCTAAFQGFYVGVHGGFAQYTAHQNDQDGFLTDNSGWTATDGKFTGGVQAGYNWQRSCNTLFGIEADWAWGKLDATTVNNPNDTPNSMTSSIKSYGTLRTRTGLVFDNLLLYVTGGLAVAVVDFKVSDPPDVFSFSDTRWGWTAGIGSEWALRQNVTFKSEILYMNFGDQSHSFISEDRFSFKTQDSIWVGRAGLNVRF
jgi:outer membrane immunogenic protein